MPESNGTDLAVVEHTDAGLSLINGPAPAMAVAYAAQVSSAIADVLAEGNGFKTIQGKKHITIEGWQTLCAMTNHSVEIEWSRPIPGMAHSNGTQTWEARALVRDQSGKVVAAGESMADPSEPDAMKKWAKGGNYAVRSMAQTRAMSRAAASRMRYIVQLAGFSGTPSEEIPEHQQVTDPNPSPAKVRFGDLMAVGADRGKDEETTKGILKLLGMSNAKALADQANYVAAVKAIVTGDRDRDAATEAAPPADADGEAGEITEEGTDEQEAVISEAQRKRMLALGKNAGLDHAAVKQIVQEVTGQDSTAQVPVSLYDQICEALERMAPAETLPGTEDAGHKDPQA